MNDKWCSKENKKNEDVNIFKDIPINFGYPIRK